MDISMFSQYLCHVVLSYLDLQLVLVKRRRLVKLLLAYVVPMMTLVPLVSLVPHLVRNIISPGPIPPLFCHHVWDYINGDGEDNLKKTDSHVCLDNQVILNGPWGMFGAIFFVIFDQPCCCVLLICCSRFAGTSAVKGNLMSPIAAPFLLKPKQKFTTSENVIIKVCPKPKHNHRFKKKDMLE